jgi:hypothetical protein
LDGFTGLLPLAVVDDVEAVDFGQLAEAAHALGKFSLGPVGEDEGFGFAFVGLFDVDDGAGNGRYRASWQQITP